MRRCVCLIALLLPIAAQAEIPESLRGDVVFYVSFDDEKTLAADWSVGAPGDSTQGEPKFAPGVAGRAVGAINARYLVKDNLRIDRPGSISMWVKPIPLAPPPPGTTMVLFGTDSSGGYLGMERQSPIVEAGVHKERAIFWFHYFKSLANISAQFTIDWREGQWHLLVISWHGANWEVFVDGKTQAQIKLPRAIRQDEIAERFMLGATTALIDEFTIYRRRLDADT